MNGRARSGVDFSFRTERPIRNIRASNLEYTGVQSGKKGGECLHMDRNLRYGFVVTFRRPAGDQGKYTLVVWRLA